MKNKSLSPGKIVWLRLKKNKPAIAGLIFISLFTFLGIFCYFIIPDNSPDSNQMSLPMCMLPPGSKVECLLVKKPVDKTNVSFFQRMLNGKPSAYKIIPLQKWYFDNDEIVFEEFTGDNSISNVKQRIKLASLFPSSTISANSLQEKAKQDCIKTKTFWLGTDRYGRDLLSRMIVASRVSLSVGFIAVIISLVIGILLGSLAGFFRGRVDQVIMWLINVVWSIPTLLLVIAITLALGKGFTQVFIAVGLTMWVEVARLVRGQIFSLREMLYVEAGRALGYSNARIIAVHILPNVLGPVIVIAASNFASAILLEAGLSFLGMGAQPPTPSWGMMIKENYGYIVADAAYLALLPGGAIALMVLSFTLLGNGLRDAFDSKLSLHSLS